MPLIHPGPLFHAEQILRKEKPLQQITALIRAFDKQTTGVLSGEKRLSFQQASQKQCYILLKGHVFLNRLDDDMTLNTESAPFIFGFSLINNAATQLTLRTSRDAVLLRLPMDKAMAIVEEQQLWQPLTHVMMYIVARIYTHCSRVAQSDSYETVRFLLIELMDEPIELRNSTAVVKYIQERTLISRSGIMHILSVLKKGGYIEINEGILHNINRLPERY